MSDDEILEALALRLTPGVGDTLFARLVERFGSSGAVRTQADVTVLRALGVPRPTALAVTTGAGRDAAARELERAKRLGVGVMVRGTSAWPEALGAVENAPAVLWVRGAWPAAGPRVAIVGTRSPDRYGLAQAGRLAAECARAGVCVVSGGAFGIDAAAHAGALQSNGRTWVVLGSALDVPYPAEHAPLFERVVAAGGALVSELPPGTPPTRGTFPRRNRLIAALGDALVVVQAATRSGALITAREASRLGRPTFAVPGPVDQRPSSGVHALLRGGARVCETLADFAPSLPGLECHALDGRAPFEGVPAEGHVGRRSGSALTRERDPLDDEARRLLDALPRGGATFDELVACTQRSPSALADGLVELELSGWVRAERGFYLRADDPLPHEAPVRSRATA